MQHDSLKQISFLRTTVHRVVNQFLNDRSVHPKKRKRKNTVTNSDNEVMILAAIAQGQNWRRKVENSWGICKWRSKGKMGGD